MSAPITIRPPIAGRTMWSLSWAVRLPSGEPSFTGRGLPAGTTEVAALRAAQVIADEPSVIYVWVIPPAGVEIARPVDTALPASSLPGPSAVLPRREPDPAPTAAQTAASGRPAGEQRVGTPFVAFLAQVREFAASDGGAIVLVVAALVGGYTVLRRIL